MPFPHIFSREPMVAKAVPQPQTGLEADPLFDKKFVKKLKRTSTVLGHQRKILDEAVENITRRLGSGAEKNLDPLINDWEVLAENYWNLSQDAKDTALTCSISLRTFEVVFVQMQTMPADPAKKQDSSSDLATNKDSQSSRATKRKSSTDSEGKRDALERFMEILEAERVKARKICRRFHELSTKVQSFDEKISSLKYTPLWVWVKKWKCSFVLRMIRGLFKHFWASMEGAVSSAVQGIGMLGKVVTGWFDNDQSTTQEEKRGPIISDTPNETYELQLAAGDEGYGPVDDDDDDDEMDGQEADDTYKQEADDKPTMKRREGKIKSVIKSIHVHEQAWHRVCTACVNLAAKAKLMRAVRSTCTRAEFNVILRAFKFLFDALLSFLKGY